MRCKSVLVCPLQVKFVDYTLVKSKVTALFIAGLLMVTVNL